MKVELGELSLARVHDLVNTKLRADAKKVEGDDRETGSRRLLKAMEVTASFWQLPRQLPKAFQERLPKTTLQLQLSNGK